MANALLLYCKERVVPWEACKKRSCQSEKCLFSRAVKKIGTDMLGSSSPKRYSAVSAMIPDKEKLIEEGQLFKTENKIVRTPVLKRTTVLAPVEGQILPNDIVNYPS